MKVIILNIIVKFFIIIYLVSFSTAYGSEVYDIGRQIASPKLKIMGGNKVTRIFHSSEGYYYVPAILPDWDSYHQRIEEVCVPPSPPLTTVTLESTGEDLLNVEKDDEFLDEETIPDITEPVIAVNFKIVLDDEAYKIEILKYLRTIKPDQVITDAMINPIPYDVVRVLINFGDETIVFYANDEAYQKYADQNYARMTMIGLDRTVENKLELTCDEHRLLVDEYRSGARDIVIGELYYVGTKFRTTSIHYMSSIGITDRVVQELISKETSTFSYDGSTKSKNWSVNLPVIGNADTRGETSGKSSLNAHRIVSRDVMRVAVSTAITESTLLCTGINGCEPAEKLILAGLSQDKLSLELRQVEGVYGLFNNQTKYVTLESSELKGATEAAIKAIRSSKETTESEGVKSTKEKGSTDEVSGKGEFGGKFPIPVDADLYLISEGSFQNYVNKKIVERIPIENAKALYFFSMLYPNFAYRDGLIADENKRMKSLEFEQACKDGANFRPRTASVKKTFASAAPRGWVWGELVADKDTYFVSPTAAHTSSANGKVRGPVTVVHQRSKILNGVGKMYSSIKAGFYCKRGRTGFGSTRVCRASGGVHAVQIPLACLPYLPDDGIPTVFK